MFALVIASMLITTDSYYNVPMYQEIQKEERKLEQMKDLFELLNGFTYDYWKDYVEFEIEYLEAWSTWEKERP